MNEITTSQIFFIISSVGFVILWSLAAVCLFYVMRIVHAFSRITDKIENNIDKIGDTTKEMLEDMRGSALFHFLLRRKKKVRKEEK